MAASRRMVVLMADDEYFGRQQQNPQDVPATPWSKGAKRVLMTEQAWFIYHAAWLVSNGKTGLPPNRIDVMNLHRARDIVFG